MRAINLNVISLLCSKNETEENRPLEMEIMEKILQEKCGVDVETASFEAKIPVHTCECFSIATRKVR